MVDCAELKRRGIAPLVASGYNANLERLQDKAAGAAFFNMEADFDGVARRMPVIMEHRGHCFGSLALMTTMAGMGGPTLKPMPAAGHRPAVLDLDGLRIPVDAAARALVPYRAADAFAYLSASDVIHARAPAASLEGRIALIGSTAPGIMDLRVTPVSKVFPGVEIHANLISGILDGTVKWEPVGIAGLEVAAIAVVGLLLAALLPIATPLWAALATLGLAVALAAANFYAWTGAHAQLPLAASLLAVWGLFVLNMSYGFFVEARSKAQITKLFGQYIPPELVDEMAKDPARYRPARRIPGDDGAVLGHRRLHPFLGEAGSRRTGRDAQHVPVHHDPGGPGWPGHHRQVHRRCRHGLLGRPHERRAPRPGRGPGRPGHAGGPAGTESAPGSPGAGRRSGSAWASTPAA